MLFRDSSIKHLIRVWMANVRTGLIREMEFRVNFVAGIIRQLVWLSSFVLLIHVIYLNTDSLAGWTQAQMLTLLALSRVIEGLSDALFNRNIGNLPEAVNSGKFDYYLTKPLPAQFHSAFHRFKLLDIGNMINGLVLLIYALLIEPSTRSFDTWLLFIIMTLLGLTIYYCLQILLVSLTFFLERFDAYIAISQLISEPLTVPFDIFPPGTKTALTYLIPLAFIVSIPAEALTNQLTIWHLPIALLITFILIVVSNLVWNAGLRRYSSASS